MRDIDRKVFEKYKGEVVTLNLKPNNFVIVGEIVEVFDECIQFETEQKTSYLDFDSVNELKVSKR